MPNTRPKPSTDAAERREVMLAVQEQILLQRPDQILLSAREIAELVEEERGVVIPICRVHRHMGWWAAQVQSVVKAAPGRGWWIHLWVSHLDLGDPVAALADRLTAEERLAGRDPSVFARAVQFDRAPLGRYSPALQQALVERLAVDWLRVPMRHALVLGGPGYGMGFCGLPSGVRMLGTSKHPNFKSSELL